tara:strand:- start:1526 stop:1771 length:246 start_codon:yes stop_codon:yes gene_type:complete
MKKTIGILAIVYGIGMSSYFGWWALRDNAALEIAVQANAPQREMRHRINVFAEGVWFLLSNMIVLQGASMAFDKKQNSGNE